MLPERLHPTAVYQEHKYPVRDPQEYELLKNHNIPHPLNAKFIRTNVRFLNEPVAHMETRHTMTEQVEIFFTLIVRRPGLVVTQLFYIVSNTFWGINKKSYLYF